MVNPRPLAERNDLNPTLTRYGWCPLDDIGLTDNGNFVHYVQPEGSPYHYKLFKGDLIPFPSFGYESRKPTNLPAVNGRIPPCIVEVVNKTALEAVEEIRSSYESWGFTILNSLTGLEQEDAARIFLLVMPFDWRLSDMETELVFADERIDAIEDMNLGTEKEPFFVECLRSSNEQIIAKGLRDEMLEGARVAATVAREVVDKTTEEMVKRHSGGIGGKITPDARDLRYAREIGQVFPKLLGNDRKEPGMDAETRDNINYLASREKTKEAQEQLAEKDREIAELKAMLGGQSLPTVDAAPKFTVGEVVTVGERLGKVIAKPFGRIKVRFEDNSEITYEAADVSKIL